MLIDTHTHLYCEEFDDDRDAVVKRAVDAGVRLMLLPAIDSLTTARQQALADAYPEYFCQMIGVHPTSINDRFEEELAHVHNLLFSNRDRYVAVGEIGLDLYWDTTFRAQQEEALMRQFDWAEQLSLPTAFHIRNAYDEFFALATRRNRSSYRGVMHCYSGTVFQAQQAVEMGFLLGIGGTLTYKKSLLPDVVRAVPLEKIILETDSPYLAPVPHRGKRNESSYIVSVAQSLSDILAKPLEFIEEVTTRNAIELFSLQSLSDKQK